MHKNLLPIVEIFSSIEGEGSKAGFFTTFIRLFNCNLRCKWCDTRYSYPPEKMQDALSVKEIIFTIKKYQNKYVCLTGGEPLLQGTKIVDLIKALSDLEDICDIHIETNGAVDLEPFVDLRDKYTNINQKLRFIMDYKLPSSGESGKMLNDNFSLLSIQDEIKFVIGNEKDFLRAKEIFEEFYQKGVVLFSPVWETMSPQELLKLIEKYQLKEVKLNLQLQKIIWDTNLRGV